MTALEPGFVVGDHVVEKCIGIGGTCQVYRARASNKPLYVAVKVLDPVWTRNDELRARFANEVEMLRTMSHPHIVSFLGAGVLAGDLPFVILEWMPFHLAKFLASGKPLLGATVHVGVQIARALVVLHRRGIVHRDIKAGNVLLDGADPEKARVCLADLGLAKVSPSERHNAAMTHVSTGGAALLGTWDTMSPEQWIKSKTVDAKSDVYSLGVVLYQMLAGRLPFVANEDRHLMALHLFEDPPMDLAHPEAGTALRELVSGMLAKLPRKRPSSVEVLERLEALQTNDG